MSVHAQKDLREAHGTKKCSSMANINTATVLHNIQFSTLPTQTNFVIE